MIYYNVKNIYYFTIITIKLDEKQKTIYDM